ncbi:Uncharacterised protein [Mesomycoplasma conjunctivae]|nr:hypothetical protein [Mesomycoplasma conjunctivae]VEU66289.1 Uncharacterised protein [Mesomycoplasma conjunctivae]
MNTKIIKLILPFFSFSTLFFMPSLINNIPIYNTNRRIDEKFAPKSRHISVSKNYNVNVNLAYQAPKAKIKISTEGDNSYGIGWLGGSNFGVSYNDKSTVKQLSAGWFSDYEWNLQQGYYPLWKRNYVKKNNGFYDINSGSGIRDDYVHNFNDIKFQRSPTQNESFSLLKVTLDNWDISSGLKEEFAKQLNNQNWSDFTLTEFKLNFAYTISDEHIVSVKTTMSATAKFQEKSLHENQEINKLNSYLNNIKNQFNTRFNGKFIIPTDTGYANGLNALASKTTNKSNKEYFHDLVNNWFDPIKTQNDNNYKAEFWYTTNSKNEPSEVFIKFYNPIDKRYEQFILSSNMKIEWQPTEFLKKQSFSSRLEFIPSYIYDYDTKTKRLVRILSPKKEINDDETKKLKEESARSNSSQLYGGKFEYFGDVGVEFSASDDENEVLYINDKPVDVLNKHFSTILKDLRLEDKEEGAINTYKVEIKQFKRDSKSKNNSEVVKTYTVHITTKSVNSILEGKWFAWDPKNNPKQKDLITENLLDSKGNPILDNQGNSVKNPNFDPYINPTTGTKKQLLWVTNKFNCSWQRCQTGIEDAIFYPDSSIAQSGFIAEAAVVGKGVNLSLNTNIKNSNTEVKRYSVNLANQNNFEIQEHNIPGLATSKKGTKEEIINNENNYFSTSGLWLFRVSHEKDQQSFKLFLIGENSNTSLFTDIVHSNYYTPFWSSLAGKNLKEYLKKERKLSEKNIDSLSYEKVLSYWKSYIDFKLNKNQIQDPNLSDLAKIIDKNLEEQIVNNQIDLKQNQKINLQVDISDFVSSLSQQQLEALKFDKNSNSAHLNFNVENLSTNSDNSKDLILDLDKNQSIPLNFKYNFEYTGIRNQDEIKKLKSTKEEILVKDFLESEIKKTITKNPFLSSDQLLEKINYLSSSITGRDDVQTIINYQGLSDYQVELKTSNEGIFFDKNKFKFNLKEIQEEAKNNYNPFSILPDNFTINLAGIDNNTQAIDYIKSQIQEATNGKLKANQDFDFVSLQPLITNSTILNPEENLSNLDLANSINLGLQSLKQPGFANIKIINTVANTQKPNITDLSKIKLDPIILKTNKESEISEELIQQLNQQLVKFDLNVQDYLTANNFNLALEKIQNNKVSDIELEPANFLTNNKLKIKVENLDFNNLISDLDIKKDVIEKRNESITWIIPAILIPIIIISVAIFFIFRKKFKTFKK